MRLDLITHHSKIITIVNKKFLSNWHNIHVELKKRRIIKMKLNIKKLITVSGAILMLTPISNGFVNSNNVQVQATTRHKKVSRSRSNKRINLPKYQQIRLGLCGNMTQLWYLLRKFRT